MVSLVDNEFLSKYYCLGLITMTNSVSYTGQKLDFPVVTHLGHFMLPLPFLYRIGLNVLYGAGHLALSYTEWW